MEIKPRCTYHMMHSKIKSLTFNSMKYLILISLSMLTNAKTLDDIKFLLNTRESPIISQLIKYSNLKDLNISHFEPARKTKFVIHGFHSSCANNVYLSIKNAYLTIDDINIFCVDWSKRAKLGYAEAIENIQIVGKHLATFIDWLVYETGLKLEDIHILGHSLGAHVAGVAGENTKYGSIDRITGLDPAVLFIEFESNKTLDNSDAKLVDLIFTSPLSSDHPLGDINYFINGGHIQPNCQSDNLLGPITCSHSRAYEIFADSILNPNKYPAFLCKTKLEATNNDCGRYNRKDLNLKFNNMNYIADGIYSVSSFYQL